MPFRFSKRRGAILGAQILSVAVMILIWEELVHYNVISSLLLAPPSAVFPNFLKVMQIHKPTGPVDVWASLMQSVSLVGIGLGIAVAVGLVLGLVIGEILFLRNVLEEYIVAFYALPKVTLLPFFWILFGISLQYRVAYGALEGALPMMLITIYAVRSVDPSLLKMAKSVGASRRQIYFKVFFPSLVPSLMGGVRIAFVTTFIGVILAEMFVGNTGIGFMVRDFTDIFATIDLYSVVLATILISVAVNIFLLGLEKYLTRWKTTSIY